MAPNLTPQAARRSTRVWMALAFVALACSSPYAPVGDMTRLVRTTGLPGVVEPGSRIAIADTLFFYEGQEALGRTRYRSATNPDSTWTVVRVFRYRVKEDRVALSNGCEMGAFCAAVLMWTWYDRTVDGFKSSDGLTRYLRVD